jgi:alpha-glucosidase
MRIRRIAFLVFFFLSSLVAQWKSIGDVTGWRALGPASYEIKAGKGSIRLSILAKDLVRLRYSPTGVFEDDKYSWTLAKQEAAWEPPSPKAVENALLLQIQTGAVLIVIQKKPFRLAFVDPDGTIMCEDDSQKGMAVDKSDVRVWKALPPDMQFYGLGEKAGSFEKRGKVVTMFNSDFFRYQPDSDPLYQSIPFFYGVRKQKAFAIFFNNTYWSSFDLGKESHSSYSFGATGGELDYFYFHGPEPSKILERFTELVGRMPMPPRWALGYQQSRWSYYPETRVREIAQTFRQKNIPCDALYLDIHYMDGYRIFTWDKNRFPDPKKMVSDLAQDGFKIIVIMDPGIKQDSSYSTFTSGLAGDHFLKYKNGNLYLGDVWPGTCAFPDFSRESTRKWWGDEMKTYRATGIRGWWTDMNEPSIFKGPMLTMNLDVVHDDFGRKTSHERNHNLYGMQMTKATYDAHRVLYPNDRPFVLTRASFAGGWKFAASWTGDNVSSWEHLQMGLSMCLGLSISGQPFVGTDIGGFVGDPEPELYTRWLQLGVFMPMMRSHSIEGSKDKEPFAYGDQFTEINKKTIEMRYRLLPYLYTAMHKASMTGLPPMRPFMATKILETEFTRTSNEFMFGDDIIVAPVLWKGVTKRSLRLPRGEWYDYYTGMKYRGLADVEVDAPLDRIPLFVRAGAIVPMQQVVQFTDQAPINPLTLKVFPHETGSSDYYEDDGISFDYQKGVYFERTFTQKKTGSVHTITLTKALGTYTPPTRVVVLEIYSTEQSPSVVTLNGTELRRMDTLGTLTEANTWMYDPSTKQVSLSINENREEQVIILK